jgi:hypothetical protein
MPSAAGIIIATGAMTLGNDFLQAQAPPDPNAPGNVAARVNFRVIPATAIAAGLFYAFEQASAPVAKGLAWIIFATAFAFPAESWGAADKSKTSPLGTLLGLTGNSTLPHRAFAVPNGQPVVINGIPYTQPNS